MSGLLALSRGIDRVTTLIGRSVAWLILLALPLITKLRRRRNGSGGGTPTERVLESAS